MPISRFAFLTLAFLVAFSGPLLAAESGGGAMDKADHVKKDADKEKPIPPEAATSTHHSVQIGARSINYTATAGTMLIRDDKHNKPNASVFYVAYSADGIKDLSTRPLTFFYNGGPGSSSVWLHMGSFAPVRVESGNASATPPPPYHLIANPDSLLDKSDLVFIDAVGTGFSRPVGNGKGKDFWGVDQDLDAFDKAITRYVTLYQRWNSPKFLFGESYGTTRSAALINQLQGHGMAFNGVVLLSSILNYAAISPGLDNRFIGDLPTFAAIAWYHDKLPQKPAQLAPFLDEVRTFARGPYAQALAKGQGLPKAEEDVIAARLHGYIGLSVQYLEEANLRVDASRFRKELLRGERRTLGRYDARYEGIDVDAAGERPEYDPSDTAISDAFTAAFHAYLAGQLHYTSDLDYRTTA
ncbi:MAG: peptidase S10, partial [Rhodanobacteraceae bacterium]